MNNLPQLALIRNLDFKKNYKIIEELSTVSEDHLQAAVCAFLQDEKLLYYAIPNGSKRTKVVRALFKFTGLISGVPDLLVCHKNKKYGGLYLELKHKKNTLSVNQKLFIKELEKNGYKCAVIRSLDNVRQVVFAYLKE